MKMRRWVLGAAVAAIAALAMACGGGAGGADGPLPLPGEEIDLLPGNVIGLIRAGGPATRLVMAGDNNDVPELHIVRRSNDWDGIDIVFHTMQLTSGGVTRTADGLVNDGVLTLGGTYTVVMEGRLGTGAGRVMIQGMPGSAWGTGSAITPADPHVTAGDDFAIYRTFALSATAPGSGTAGIGTDLPGGADGPWDRARIATDSTAATANLIITNVEIRRGTGDAGDLVWDLWRAIFPVPTGVTITPNVDVEVVQGRTQAFTAEVIPSGALQSVAWDITYPATLPAELEISAGGVLSVPVDFAPGTNAITVRARATADMDYYATVQVTVIARPTDLEITPHDNVEVDQGAYQDFVANVLPAGAASAVTWSTEPASIPHVSISAAGRLTIGPLATAGDIVVRAVAYYNDAAYDEVTVTIAAADVYKIELEADGLEEDGGDFLLDLGYAEIGTAFPVATITVRNIGNMATGELTIASSSATDFAVYPLTIADIAIGGSATFTVTPYAGLAIGIHTADITVSSANAELDDWEFEVSLEVMAPPTGVNASAAGNVAFVRVDSTLQFSAIVEPPEASQAVVWSIQYPANPAAAGLSISAAGLLTIAEYATTSEDVIVRATADGHPGVYDYVTVFVAGAASVAVALYEGGLVAGVEGSVTFTVTASYLMGLSDGVINFTAANVTGALPSGVAISASDSSIDIEDNAGTGTLVFTGTDAIVAGTHPLTVTLDGVARNFDLVIAPYEFFNLQTVPGAATSDPFVPGHGLAVNATATANWAAGPDGAYALAITGRGNRHGGINLMHSVLRFEAGDIVTVTARMAPHSAGWGDAFMLHSGPGWANIAQSANAHDGSTVTFSHTLSPANATAVEASGMVSIQTNQEDAGAFTNFWIYSITVARPSGPPAPPPPTCDCLGEECLANGACACDVGGDCTICTCGGVIFDLSAVTGLVGGGNTLTGTSWLQARGNESLPNIAVTGGIAPIVVTERGEDWRGLEIRLRDNASSFGDGAYTITVTGTTAPNTAVRFAGQPGLPQGGWLNHYVTSDETTGAFEIVYTITVAAGVFTVSGGGGGADNPERLYIKQGTTVDFTISNIVIQRAP